MPAIPTGTVYHRPGTAQSLAELYMRACVLIARHYRAPLTLAATAAALAYSPRQLQRAFAQIGHTSFSEQLRSVRMRNAAELLATQSLTVADVARLVGYGGAPHFVTAFRACYGTTPGAYRDRARARRAEGRERAPGQSVTAGVQT